MVPAHQKVQYLANDHGHFCTLDQLMTHILLEGSDLQMSLFQTFFCMKYVYRNKESLKNVKKEKEKVSCTV